MHFHRFFQNFLGIFPLGCYGPVLNWAEILILNDTWKTLVAKQKTKRKLFSV